MRILYVEDSIEFRCRTITRYLPDAEVTEATTVHSALLIIGTGALQFDVALLDYELPDGTGVEVLRALRAVAPTIRIIGVSADSSYNRALLDAGADAAVPKGRFHRLRETLGLGAAD